MIEAHVTILEQGESVRTELIKDKTRGDLFHKCQQFYGHCLGKDTLEDGTTKAWTFSFCEKKGKQCKVFQAYCEFL